MCRHQPPFYEKEINGVCVQDKPKAQEAGVLDGLPIILILSLIGVIIYSAGKSIK
jgi:hypothetical protein